MSVRIPDTDVPQIRTLPSRDDDVSSCGAGGVSARPRAACSRHYSCYKGRSRPATTASHHAVREGSRRDPELLAAATILVKKGAPAPRRRARHARQKHKMAQDGLVLSDAFASLELTRIRNARNARSAENIC